MQKQLKCFFILVIGFVFLSCEPPKKTRKIDNGSDNHDVPAAYTNAPVSIGHNTWFLRDWDGSRAFIDIMKPARPWQNADANADLTGIQLDSLGWPLTDCGTVFLTHVNAELDNGEYSLVFEGSADVSVEWVSNVTVRDYVYDPVTNISTAKIVLSYNRDVGAAPRIVFRNTKRDAASGVNTGVRNVKLFRPGYSPDTAQVFTKEFLKGFTHSSIFRPMETMNINMNTIRSWSERTTPFSGSQSIMPPPVTITRLDPAEQLTLQGGNSAYGIALEHIVQLSNETNNDLWICIPPFADDEYIAKTFQLIMYGSDGINPYSSVTPNPLFPPLKQNLKIYVEYGNELWNTGMNAFWGFYIVQHIVSTLSSDHPVLKKFPLSSSLYQAVYVYPAFKLAEISRYLRSQYGDGAMISRIRPVLCTQQGDANATLSLCLTWADDYYRKELGIQLNELYYGAGGSAYYDVDVNHSNFDALLAKSNYPDPVFLAYNKIDSTWAYNYGLRRVAYEGGMSLDMADSNYKPIFNSEQMKSLMNDERLYDVMMKTHTAWEQTGGDDLVYYCLVGPESWALIHNTGDYSTPKMRAFNDIAGRKKARVTMGGKLPGTVAAADVYPDTQSTRIIRTGWGYYHETDGKKCIGGNNNGNMIAIPAHTDAAFHGTFRLQGSSGTDSVLGIWVNGLKQGVVTLAAGSTIADSTEIPVTIPEGLAVIRIEVENGGYSLYSITIK